ncbi:MAG TPA: TPM domain-containing protein, partial [Xanthomonadales bacterium]|nr:TPM domain-containing protein [Xanthomonadales bacterium]
AAGETRHLGEVCFAVESRHAPLDALLGPGTRQRAEHLFGQLRVWDTEQNSGVLVYVLLCEHRIEIVADRGIAARVDAKEWAALCETIGRSFAAGDPATGVKDAIARIHDILATHFPAQGENPRELSDVPYVL